MLDTTSERNEGLGRLAAAVLALSVALFPVAEASHGGWWLARDTPTTHPDYPNPGSHAKFAGMRTSDVWAHWSGGDGGAGTLELRYYDPYTRQETGHYFVTAVEDITSVTFDECPFANSSGVNFEIVPTYSLSAPGVLYVEGPMRNSFCNDSTVPDGNNPIANDPLYYKAFSDFKGWHAPHVDGVPDLFELELYVRGLDHA